jgi:hypothetical protein
MPKDRTLQRFTELKNRMLSKSNVSKRTIRCAALSLLVAGGVSVNHSAYGQANNTNSTTGANFTNAGSSGGTFQNIWVGARAAGMGGAYSALADDITALYWNPAGIARIGNGINVGATYTRWFGDIAHNFVGAVLPISEKYRAGVSMTFVDYGSLRKSTIDKDYNAGTFNANDLAIGLTLAGALTDRFSFGVTARYIHNAILDLSADGISFDAGSLYQTDFYNMKISLDLSNLGPDRGFQGNSLALLANNPSLNVVGRALDTRLVTSDFPIPLTFRIGVATDIFQNKIEGQKLNVAVDFATHSDNAETFNLGGEYLWNDLVALRAGYAFNQDQLGFAGGLGVRYKSEDFNGNIDYAISPTRTFGLIHRISISAAFQ